MPIQRRCPIVALGACLAACAPASAQQVESPRDDAAQTMQAATAADVHEAELELSESPSEVVGSSGKSSGALPKVLHRRGTAKCGRDKGVGDKLEDFRLPSLGGETVTDQSFGGQVLVVNFWGTWCKPCLKELPEFDRLYRHYRKHGVTLLAIATDEEKQGVQDFVRKHKLAAKVAYGGESYATGYGHDRFPFTFVVDPQGVIRGAYSGFRPECMGQLEADIRTEIERAHE